MELKNVFIYLPAKARGHFEKPSKGKEAFLHFAKHFCVLE